MPTLGFSESGIRIKIAGPSLRSLGTEISSTLNSVGRYRKCTVACGICSTPGSLVTHSAGINWRLAMSATIPPMSRGARRLRAPSTTLPDVAMAMAVTSRSLSAVRGTSLSGQRYFASRSVCLQSLQQSNRLAQAWLISHRGHHYADIAHHLDDLN